MSKIILPTINLLTFGGLLLISVISPITIYNNYYFAFYALILFVLFTTSQMLFILRRHNISVYAASIITIIIYVASYFYMLYLYGPNSVQANSNTFIIGFLIIVNIAYTFIVFSYRSLKNEDEN